ncbi:MAG: cyclase family protein [Chloroflexota bacterium]|jgi:arylformamidase
MRIYDISLGISSALPTWPGDPKIHLEQVSKISEGHASNITKIEMSAHTGTHIDAPYHFIESGMTVDQIPLKVLTGRVYVLHLPDVSLITADILKETTLPPRTRRILFKTRNSDNWVKDNAEFEKDFVALSPDGAQYLVDRNICLVGIDYLSVAPFLDPTPTHEILLKAGVVIVEGLNLSKIKQGRYSFYCLPLKITGAEGAPARAILIGA